MIYGQVIDGRVIIPVVFRLPSQPDFSLDFVIDTGFNDHATKVRVDATKVRVDATKVRVDATKVQGDASKVQVDASKVQGDASKVQIKRLVCTP
ncbi:hypothetical protein ANSO36C_53120 [Nostoc cf. commune SO-36]|uniref:Uncharacterized protein n=1 Tax=Nostoc cf. commune SO-36 TaxID=449208 RepID=A0ABN6QBA8_NOSCO|nr:hypothetical protein [Nostoc commune]BDI19510.1 hypothetical protein ANSO36C_53120 [Nostoc cf. commune SO-36]